MHKTLNLLCIEELDIIKTVNIYLTTLSKSTLHMKCIKLVVMNDYHSAYIDVKNVIVFVII